METFPLEFYEIVKGNPRHRPIHDVGKLVPSYKGVLLFQKFLGKSTPLTMFTPYKSTETILSLKNCHMYRWAPLSFPNLLPPPFIWLDMACILLLAVLSHTTLGNIKKIAFNYWIVTLYSSMVQQLYILTRLCILYVCNYFAYFPMQQLATMPLTEKIKVHKSMSVKYLVHERKYSTLNIQRRDLINLIVYKVQLI